MRKRRATLNKLILYDFLMKFVECVLVITLTKPIENNIPTKHHHLSTLLELNINPEGAQGALFNFFGPSENFLRILKKKFRRAWIIYKKNRWYVNFLSFHLI